MTIKGRERYPVRVRYARDFRDDVEALKEILVSAPGWLPAAERRRHGRDERRMAAGRRSARPSRLRCKFRWPQWPTSGSSKDRR